MNNIKIKKMYVITLIVHGIYLFSGLILDIFLNKLGLRCIFLSIGNFQQMN